ncbi:hypothetical protein BDV95DRAFT_572856 [Massariosphaeria phaeospora]|uniref:Uncharacterized protein n=1 Tax=Massariosphaeria phaeospora TaxID=100035 RepID=A0A7C8M8C3_9PLEO|nr:hypothetical protein BDV95DRAFT_572856 [Massariosphaeria phaeospora]
MAHAWAQSQRSGWLCRLYGSPDASASGARTLSPLTVQSRLLDIVEAALIGTSAPADAAVATASLIMSQEDVSTPWANLTGLWLNAAESLADKQELRTLVEYVVAVAGLPDAVNEGPGVKVVDTGGGLISRIEPGQAVCDGKLRFWQDLPSYSWTLGDVFQGPESWIFTAEPATPAVATANWRNLNTYLALVAAHPRAQTIPGLANHLSLCRVPLAQLEYSPDSRRGEYTALHGPAIMQWLRIAGAEIEEMCRGEKERMQAGDLWDGGDVCGLERLAFWKRRVVELRF